LSEEEKLLEIRDLEIAFKTDNGWLNAVQGLNFSISKGEAMALVGESGCGKSITSMSIMRLLGPNAKVTGTVNYKGQNLLENSRRKMEKLRGKEIAMIFQEPMTALNPVLRIGDQIKEPLRLHEKLSKKGMDDRVLELLNQVGIPRPKAVANEYIHQLSGGMRQRVMIAMAMACNPTLLVADEPTTALDVTVQAQILELLQRLQEENNMALLLITHDLGVVAEVCQRAAVMYAGKIVEESDTKTLFANPRHPYTQGLLESLPKLTGKRERLKPIIGNVPSLANMPAGCRFAPRCPKAMPICSQSEPRFIHVESGHQTSCWAESEEVLA
jgi:oligopeptide/dipeptide ABC transporter ATP-binding protein